MMRSNNSPDHQMRNSRRPTFSSPIRFSACVAAFAALWVGQARCEDIGFDTAALQRASEFCSKQYADKRLDILRQKIPLNGTALTTEMLSLDRRPTPAEASAVMSLFDLETTCSIATANALNPKNPVQSILDVPPSWTQSLAALAVLGRGKVTFAQYNQSVQKLIADLEEKRQATKQRLDLAMDQEAAARKADEASRAQIMLACVLESPDTFRGREFQYRVDTQSNAVYANRGPAAPANIQITDSEIRFTQEDLVVSISRLSGIFSISRNGSAVTGHCTKVASRAF